MVCDTMDIAHPRLPGRMQGQWRFEERQDVAHLATHLTMPG